MKAKFMNVAFVAAIAIVGGINASNAHKTEVLSDFVLANVEALSDTEEGGTSEFGCGGNPTWIKNQALQSATCWNGGSHKVCKSMDGVCCDPSQMTDCSPLIQ